MNTSRLLGAAAGLAVLGWGPAPAQTAAGEQVYRDAGCVVCHGGLGTGGFGPRLSGDPILAVEQFVIAQILIGRREMPPFADKLNDAQIAAVAQYIRTSWGNDFGPVSAQDVAQTRQLMQRAQAVAAHARQVQATPAPAPQPPPQQVPPQQPEQGH